MDKLKIFESRKIRSHWDENEEKWYFSIVDIIQVLTESLNPTDYLKKLRKRDILLGSYIGTNCPQVAMTTETGKKRKTLAGDVEQIFRIIQSIPSPKAEPFKQWLARVGNERIQEIADPEQSLDRARENWQKLGRSNKWIQQRMMGQETRNKLTDYWKQSGVEKSDDFAKLTNIIHEEWAGLSVKEHKQFKNLKSQNLRDHTALAELSTRNIAETEEAKGVVENAKASKRGGAIAKRAKDDFEAQTKQQVITNENFLPPNNKIEEIK